MAEVEETLKRIQAHRGVFATIVTNAEEPGLEDHVVGYRKGERGALNCCFCMYFFSPEFFVFGKNKYTSTSHSLPRKSYSTNTSGENYLLNKFDLLWEAFLDPAKHPQVIYIVSSQEEEQVSFQATFGRSLEQPKGKLVTETTFQKLGSSGIPIRTTLDNSTTVQYAALLQQLTKKARSTVRDIDPQNDLTFLRIRSKKYEIMVAPDKEYLLIIMQNPDE